MSITLPIGTHEIACDNNTHRMQVYPSGRIRLLDHCLNDELVGGQMGAAIPPCVNFLMTLRDFPKAWDGGAWTKVQRQVLAYTLQEREERRGEWDQDEHVNSPFPRRYTESVLFPVVEQLLRSQCLYFDFNGRPFEKFIVSWSEFPTIYQMATDLSARYTRIGICIDWDWYKVWKRGIAVVDGKLVLRLLGEDDTHYSVVIGDQDRGGTWRRHALIDRRTHALTWGLDRTG
jgi:hypothetical protein